MKRLRRPISRRDFLRITGISATALAATACGSSAPSTPTGATSASTAAESTAALASSSPVASMVNTGARETLRIALFGTQQGADDARENIAPVFAKLQPQADLQFIGIEGRDWDEYFTKILALVAAGDTPDMAFAATEGTQLFASKLAAPLDEYVKRDQAVMAEYFADVHPSLIQSMMYEGSLYELPIDWNAANMYVNTQLLKEAGYDNVSSDWTKDQFYEIAKKIAKKDASGKTEVAGYQWVNRLWGSWLPWIFVNDSNLLVEEQAPGGEWVWDTFYKGDAAVQGRGGGWRWPAPKANDPANLEALEFMIQMKQEGITPDIDFGGGTSLEGLFGGNKIGMTPAGGFWAGGLHNAGLAPEQFNVLLFPKWKSQRHQFGAAGYVIMKDSQSKDLAWEFVKYTAAKDTMMSSDALKNNFTTSPRRSMLTAQQYATTGPANWQVFYDTLDKYPDTAPIPAPPEANQITSIFTKYTGLAMAGDSTAKDALDGMQQELEAVYAKRK
jgi:multiple sugar transport system substrate-binding protein